MVRWCRKCEKDTNRHPRGECKPCQKRRNLRLRYGLTPEQESQMREDQDGKCAICLEERPLRVDHNHTTNQVRALLCDSCNLLIGHAKECPRRLLAARHYLINSP